MQKQKSNVAGLPVESIVHQDTRLNIPTEELRGFVAEEETAYSTMLYPRDPSLDPQLVWKGKDEQDAADLAVPVVPIYIQEKISPRVLIADLKRSRGTSTSDVEEQIDFFSDFSGLEGDFARSVEFYQHDQHWSNRMILGDSLYVMTSLAEKEGLKGKVQTIYLDPPYGIKFGSNWQVSTRKRDVKDGKSDDATRQPEQVRAFRDTWQLGIHSYLAYMRDRLTAARELLTDSGSIFVQIGDENVHLVRVLLDEVFGSENFVVSIVIKKKGATTPTDPVNDYILWASKHRETAKIRQLYERRRPLGTGSKFTTLIMPDGERLPIARLTDDEIEKLTKSGARYARVDWPLVSQDPSDRSRPFVWNGIEYPCATGRHWTYDPDKQMPKLALAGRLNLDAKRVSGIVYWDDWPYESRSNLWDDTGAQQGLVYVVQTSTKVVERCILMTTDPGDLVLDPTGGSGTTAFVAEEWGRRWITIDTSRVALTIARMRLMTAKFPFYLLSDSEAGALKRAETAGFTPTTASFQRDVRKGFVSRQEPRVTLELIAKNPDIHDGISRAEIDAAIARHADTETLYDQPYEDRKIVRVTGPFTVESLSPHRVLATGDDNLDGTVSETEALQQQDFATMILDNLRKAGAQNTNRNERLTFDRLEPYAGAWIHATGEYTDAAGEARRVAVSIGPEHGTVGPQQVKDAAKEAVQGPGHDLLLVCGFAFDPHVAEEAKRFGRLTVLPTRMNPDLAMGDELLKKTGAGNLFMVFGEPDVEIKRTDDGKVTVEITGLDVYDPTTGAIRSSSAGNLDYDIAAWFIDTDYDGESFFVRHAYFTGGGEPYEKLKRALRAEIDEEAWASLYSTTSRPFPQPTTGKIAVKVINHYGDEVLKVYPVK